MENYSPLDLLVKHIQENAFQIIGTRLRQAAKLTQNAKKSAREQKRPVTSKKLSP